ncbi:MULTISPECIES: methyltransferase family protein [Gammaproteobacteria]|jgi:protein-S-isoprenylcysteine O-methyltransferase Ste14|uniref:Isoprenylcysteine carboxylmethyltransferase family protein n=1 Tax=Vreelandella halophila TaxID=86177 RepID=A0A9X5B511_9GAMM|nr:MULTISPECIES: isoprenylcysteine carboxylmethyltransferase family protein [Gammaproteobacteria]KAA8983377.1 isoprenylcysteine carboxylmethyltransferase family protein [Halospina sp. K52047b]MYL27086.1 isoprenylcysteine carboxylmethyltransferase family protein [Halomonas utahensis]MYL74288.1 isoprenylcysteine carboxylmethyltransferase family protein [Halomonas sp. 22501_18_FS]
MSAELFTRCFVATYFLLIGLFFTGRTLGLSARTRHSHIHYGHVGSRPWWNRHIFNVFRAAILLISVLRIGLPVDPWLGIIEPLYSAPVLLSGVVLLCAAFTGINYLQAYMHEDWRSGIDTENPPKLLTTGPWSRSRNPMFLIIMLGQLGFFLALPSLFSLVCLVVGVAVLRRQALAEETSLNTLLGADYRQYRERVPRWF